MTNYKGHWVQAIKIDGIPAGTMGVIQEMDLDGRFIVAWENGILGVVRERGDIYRIVDIPQKSFWNFKNLLLILRNKFKQIYNGK